MAKRKKAFSLQIQMLFYSDVHSLTQKRRAFQMERERVPNRHALWRPLRNGFCPVFVEHSILTKCMAKSSIEYMHVFGFNFDIACSTQ